MTLLLPIVRAALTLSLAGSVTHSGTARQEKIKYFTRFGDQVLSQSEAIVSGRIGSVSPAPRAELVQVEVLRAFKGDVKDGVSVLANRGEFFAGSEVLMFLAKYQEGPRYTCFNRISLSDPDYGAKETHLEEQLTLEEVSEEEDRRSRARNLLLRNAASDRKWTRWNSLRELAYVLKTYPDLIADADADELAQIARQSADEEFRRELLELLKTRKQDRIAPEEGEATSESETRDSREFEGVHRAGADRAPVDPLLAPGPSASDRADRRGERRSR